MVKVKDVPMAEANKPISTTNSTPTSTTSTYLQSSSVHNNLYTNLHSHIRKPPRTHNHTHHIHQTIHHYSYLHHHCSSLSENHDTNCSNGSSPAKFYFGPGFEPQSQITTGSVSGNGANNCFCPGPSNNQNSSEYVVLFHVNPGVTISFQIGDSLEILRVMVAGQNADTQQNADMYCAVYGDYYTDNQYYIPGAPPEMCPAHVCAMQNDFGPVTVPMVSTNSSPPIAMPVQVPPGHVLQQIVDESGTLRHVILSTQHPAAIVPLSSHNPPHYGGGPGNSTNQPQQAFYQGMATGFSPASHFHSNMQTGGHSGPNPTHLGHSSSLPNQTFYKDERTQRQHIKLKKKFQEKQTKLGECKNTSTSSRREVPNCLRTTQATTITTSAKEKDMNSIGTSEDGEESSIPDEEDNLQIIADILSSVQAPKVSELSSRSALLQWATPTISDNPDIDATELRYEVLLSDKSKEMKFKSIYSGVSLSCRIRDLRPGQEYSVCLQVHYEELQGAATDPVKFITPPCEPDQPQPPKLYQRQKTSLQLKWNSVNDNGSHILGYILEYDEGKGGNFVEFHRSKVKQYTLNKLQPATSYRFRLAAINEVGKSEYSETVTYSTYSNPPPKPQVPSLVEAFTDSLRLAWHRQFNDEDYTLQINDPVTGYRPIYSGRDTTCVCAPLHHFTEYKFRLRAANDGGQSPWSDEIVFKTLPDRPARPSKPVVKGRIHAHSFKLKWDPPNVTGGAEITEYLLEVNSGRGYETVYRGNDTEAVCDKLNPGTTYQLRVSCMSNGGHSNYSDPCTVTTDAISPGRCAAPKLHGKPKPNSIALKWCEPDYNGGAPVLEYEVEMSGPSAFQRKLIHKNKEIECTAVDLLPGVEYSFFVRAVNRIGPGHWSDELKVTSGAAPPDAPSLPNLICKSPFHIFVNWKEPLCNGATINEYRLEISIKSDEDFHLVYQGADNSYDVKGLTPSTPYFFRVQACNSAGYSPFSLVAASITRAAPPATVTTLRGESTPTSIMLNWNEPAHNGSPIINYNIELSDKVISTDSPKTEYLLENLHPDFLYKIKVQAVNAIGYGSYSSVMKIATLRLPPVAPRLECVAIGHNYLKLKWGDGKNFDYTQYLVEMEHVHFRDFQCVYKGTALNYKVNKLNELQTYKFRICATNDAGVGEYSPIYEFATCISPPGAIKQPKLFEVDQRSCSIEWTPARNQFSDSVEYQVQVSKTKELLFKDVYRGAEAKCTIENLEPGVEYSARIAPIRLTSSGDLAGPFSPILSFSTLPTEVIVASKLMNCNLIQHNHSKNRLQIPSLLQINRWKTYSNKPVFYAVLITIIGIIISIWIMTFL